MSISDTLKSLPEKTGIWRPAPPASKDAVQWLLKESRLDLPESYLELLLNSNGGEGDIPVQPYWTAFWAAEEVMEANRDYELADYVPGFFAFGGNGGGEMLAFDTRTSAPWKIYAIPYIGNGESDALLVAESFEQFVEMIGHPSEDIETST